MNLYIAKSQHKEPQHVTKSGITSPCVASIMKPFQLNPGITNPILRNLGITRPRISKSRYTAPVEFRYFQI